MRLGRTSANMCSSAGYAFRSSSNRGRNTSRITLFLIRICVNTAFIRGLAKGTTENNTEDRSGRQNRFKARIHTTTKRSQMRDTNEKQEK